MGDKVEKTGVQYNKESLIAQIVENDKCTPAEADKKINSFNEGVGALIAKMNAGDKLQLLGYLTLEVRYVAERAGSNPRTKEPLVIPANNALKAKAGKLWTDRVAQPQAIKEEPKGKGKGKGKADKTTKTAEKEVKGKGGKAKTK